MVATVGALTAADDVVLPADVVLVVGGIVLGVGVARVADGFEVTGVDDVFVSGVVLTAVLPLGVVATTTDEPAADDPVDTTDTAAELTTTTDVATELAVDGTAVSIVGPA